MKKKIGILPRLFVAIARKRGAAEPKGKYGVPQWVLDDKSDSGTGIYTWVNWMEGWTADDKPRPAGLLGPVRVVQPMSN